MTITGRTLFAFVDPKDPFMSSGIEGEGLPGPILSILAARPFESLVLFNTPHTRTNAAAASAEVRRRHPACNLTVHELQISDPKDYSALMGRLAREVRSALRMSGGTQNYVCVSSGTAEMRTAWFILTATGVLPATLLQIGSPAEPLFGAANVKEVRLEDSGWLDLRDLVMPLEYFERPHWSALESRDICSSAGPTSAAAEDPDQLLLESPGILFSRQSAPPRRRLTLRQAPPAPAPRESPLDEALRELDIYVGSTEMQQAAERAAIAGAESYVPVLLTGETGTGKEMFARLIHRMSPRRSREMVCINCAAIPKDLVESHLFGHVKGAFTSAVNDQAGKFEAANGSTLFLDEIGELTPEAQSKLLRVLQDGRIEPVGSNKSKKLDVRIVAATNRDLSAEIAAGRFRDDLYFRLAVAVVDLPPLRKRASEIPQLAAALLKSINQRAQNPRQLSKAALQRLVEHPWPGNVRELGSVLRSSALFARTEVIELADLKFPLKIASSDPLAFLPDPCAGFDLLAFLEDVKRRLVHRALQLSGNNQTTAAALLGLTKQAVSRILKSGNDNRD
jgi:DNA-binding NtrC family response regulator